MDARASGTHADAAVAEELPARAVFQVFLVEIHGEALAVFDPLSR